MDAEALDHLRGLDANFVELFNGGQLADLFEGVPPELHEERIRQLNGVITANLRTYRHRRAREGGFVHLHWLFGILPLPLVNYRLLWRYYGIPNAGQLLYNLGAQLLKVTLRLVQLVAFLVVSSTYLLVILSNVFTFSNMLTFSEDFFGDFVAFSMRHNAGLLARKAEMFGHDVDLMLSLQQQEWNGVFSWLLDALYSSLALFLRARCIKNLDLGVSRCEVLEDTLLFRFASVFEKHGLASDLWESTAATATLYLFYALGGDLVCINVSWLYGQSIVRRLLPYKDVTYNLIMILYKSLGKTA